MSHYLIGYEWRDKQLHVIGTKALLRSLPKERAYNRHLVLQELKAKPLVAVTDLVDRLYGDDPDGGPLCAERTVRGIVHKLRKAGHAIETFRGRGYTLKRAA